MKLGISGNLQTRNCYKYFLCKLHFYFQVPNHISPGHRWMVDIFELWLLKNTSFLCCPGITVEWENTWVCLWLFWHCFIFWQSWRNTSSWSVAASGRLVGSRANIWMIISRIVSQKRRLLIFGNWNKVLMKYYSPYQFIQTTP